MTAKPDKEWTNTELCHATGLLPGSILVAVNTLERQGKVISELRETPDYIYAKRRFYRLVGSPAL